MNKSELVSAIAEKTGEQKKRVAAFVDAFIDVVTDTLSQGKKIQLVGFGTFEVKERAPRKGRNPRTGEVIEIPARKVPVFRPGKELRKRVIGEE